MISLLLFEVILSNEHLQQEISSNLVLNHVYYVYCQDHVQVIIMICSEAKRSLKRLNGCKSERFFRSKNGQEKEQQQLEHTSSQQRME